MARPSRPLHLKLLAGERESRINRGEPLPADTDIIPPPMSEAARLVWEELADDLAKRGCLSSWDAPLFAVFCDAVATYREVRTAIGSEFLKGGSTRGTSVVTPMWRVARDCIEVMTKIGGKFGLTPSDRASLDLSESDTAPPKYGPARILS